MRKLIISISMGLMCMGLCACDGTGFDPAMIQDTTKAIEDAASAIDQATQTFDQASKTVEEVTESLDDMEQYIGMITDSMQQGVDSTNAFVEWYENDAIPKNPWINPPITQEEVENAIRAGEDELRAYIAANVDKNAQYDALSSEDMEFFTEYFSDDSVNGFLVSTYEKPEACDAYEALSRYTEIIKKPAKGDDTEAEGRIYKKDVDEALLSTIGITSDELNKPLEFTGDPDKEFIYIDKVKDCEELHCSGGFYYNNLYLVIMTSGNGGVPFSATALSKDDDGSVRIYHNYWTDDTDYLNWDGSIFFDLYELMLNSDLKAAIQVPGLNGDINLGTAFEAVSGLKDKGKEIEDTLELVSGKKDRIKTYMQEFSDYNVYYSNVDPANIGEYVVSQIDVTGGDFKTSEGIGIGTGIEEIKSAYGEGIEAMLSGGRKQLVYEMGKYDMLFIIDKAGKVSEMTIFLADGALGQ